MQYSRPGRSTSWLGENEVIFSEVISAQLTDWERRYRGLGGFAGRRGGPVAWTGRRRTTDRARGRADGYIQAAGNDRTRGDRCSHCEDQAPSPGPQRMRPSVRPAAVPPCSGPAGEPLPSRSCPVAQRSFSSCPESVSHGSNCVGAFQSLNELFTKKGRLNYF